MNNGVYCTKCEAFDATVSLSDEKFSINAMNFVLYSFFFFGTIRILSQKRNRFLKKPEKVFYFFFGEVLHYNREHLIPKAT